MPKQFRCSIFLFWLLAAGLAGCQSHPDEVPLSRFEFTEPHMGTSFSIVLYAPDELTATHAAEAAFRAVARLDQMMTDYDPHSELMRLCRQPFGQPVMVSPELFELIQESIRVCRETEGAFDITIGPLVQAWRVARKTKVLPTPKQIAELRQSIGCEKLQLDVKTHSITLLAPGMQLDLGGIAKGYAADKALAMLRQFHVSRALVAASGDIAIGDSPPGKKGWRVGIQALGGTENQLSKTVLLHNAGVSTSGATEQYVEINSIRYSHIIDPATGLGMTNHIQTTIIGPDATTTDGLDTPTAIMGVTRGLALIDSQHKLAALFSEKVGSETKLYPSKRFKNILTAP